ncbi:MAG: U32 family peptidase C-terminal domain-containing protein [Lactobacillaceae bacterium]|nr:U32 family peptidase C-terminal domain-containing protein [Lactobacillaceae bacterium]
MRESELLMPAGSLTKLKTAILYGADAVYAGTPDMSLRTQSQFSLEDLKEGIEFVHSLGKRIYLTLNLYTHNRDIEKLPNFVKTIRELKPDGVIMADPGVFRYFKQHAPEIKRHISTQANVCSYETVNFWQDLGADLCVLGREVTFDELTEIREKCSDIRLETFVHGAMCMSYSGRCLISNFLANRSANQGKCAHCCRWHYKLNIRLKDGTIKDLIVDENNKDLFEFLVEEDFRPGEFIEIMEDERGSYIMNSKDMCLLPRLDKILDLGIESLKIEGRNKTEYYAAIVARTYRKAIDDYRKDPKNWDYKKYMGEINTLQNRGYTLGFFEGELTDIAQNYEYTRTLGDWMFAGSIVEWRGGDAIFELRNHIEEGDWIEFLKPGSFENVRVMFNEFEDAETGEITSRVSAGQGKKIRIKASQFGIENVKDILPKFSIARRPSNLTPENETLLRKVQEEYKIESK